MDEQFYVETAEENHKFNVSGFPMEQKQRNERKKKTFIALGCLYLKVSTAILLLSFWSFSGRYLQVCLRSLCDCTSWLLLVFPPFPRVYLSLCSAEQWFLSGVFSLLPLKQPRVGKERRRKLLGLAGQQLITLPCTVICVAPTSVNLFEWSSLSVLEPLELRHNQVSLFPLILMKRFAFIG